MQSTHLLVVQDEAFAALATDLAQQYGFHVVADLPNRDDFFLCLDSQGLSLKQGNQPRTSVKVDFSAGSNAHRLRFGGGLGQDIAKAVGVSGAYQPSVVDATAGLGRDAFVLASLGCTVVAQERHPVVAALLEDGLKRAQQTPDTYAITQRIRFVYGASQTLLTPQTDPAQQPDVVYLDPMFAQEGKQQAQVKKEMQAFRNLIGQDTDADELLAQAYAHARCRVVVKRARKAEPMANKKPSYSLIGKANRFDVYVKAKVAPLTV